MSRFIRVPRADKSVLYLINSDYVRTVILDENCQTPTVLIAEKGQRRNGPDLEVEFDTIEAAIDWIDKNFILFNK